MPYSALQYQSPPISKVCLSCAAAGSASRVGLKPFKNDEAGAWAAQKCPGPKGAEGPGT